MKKLNTVLSVLSAAAALTFGLASAQATPSTVAMHDLKLVSEKAASKPSADIRIIGIVGHGGHGGGHGYYGGHRGGHGYYGGHRGGHGYYGGHRGGHGYYGGHHGGHGRGHR